MMIAILAINIVIMVTSYNKVQMEKQFLHRKFEKWSSSKRKDKNGGPTLIISAKNVRK